MRRGYVHLVFNGTRAKNTKMRACEVQSVPVFLLATNVGPYTRTDRWWRSRALIKVSE
jgi:hypothetical protein